MGHLMTLAGTRIWVVGSDAGSRRAIAERLESSGARANELSGFVECDERIDGLDPGSIPDLAVIELLLDDGVGADLVRRLSNPVIFCPCVITTKPSCSARHVLNVLTWGAYVVTEKPFPVLETCGSAIEWGRERRATISRSLAPASNPSASDARDPLGWATLTACERVVARLYGDGETRDAIARARGVSVNTVKTQIRSIYDKLEIDSRAGLRALLKKQHTGGSTSAGRTRQCSPSTPCTSTRYSRTDRNRRCRRSRPGCPRCCTRRPPWGPCSCS